MNPYLAIAVWLLLALIGVLLSAIFSGVETGIYRVNRVRLRLRSENGEPQARILARLMRNQHSLLGTLLIGNNISNYLASSAIVAMCSFTALAEWQIVVLVPIILAPVLMLFGEIIPKNIFRAYGERYTYSFATMLKVVHWLLLATGMLLLVDALSRTLLRLARRRVVPEADQLYHPRQQVGLLITESLHQGALSPYQSLLIDRVMNLRNVRVGQVMVPLPRVRSVPATIGRGQFIAQARKHNHARVLAWSDRPANAVGVIPVNAVLASTEPDRPVSDFVREVPRLNADRTVVAALLTLQGASLGMGIVVDKSGAAVGIVTVRDLIEEIVGEIGEL